MKTTRTTPDFYLAPGFWFLDVTGRSIARFVKSVGWLFLLVAASGCRSVGPATVPRDRFAYSGSIGESWKRQTLLNIVKLRYLDPPIFVDVGQIVAGYSLETALNAGGTIPETSALGGNTATVGGSVRFTDRPTITYTPLTGNKFVRALMTPLPPTSVLSAVQSGYPADVVFSAAVGAVNGLKNQESTLAGVSPAAPAFIRVVQLLQSLQISGAVGMRLQPENQGGQTTLLTFRSGQVSEATEADIRELRKLLHLDPNVSQFQVVFGATARNDREIAILTRSLLQIMNAMAAQVEIPAQDIADGRATPGFASLPVASQGQHLVRIHSSKTRPKDAYAAILYRDHWFWIDDCDLKTKRAFAFMMMLFTLSEPGERENLPLLTIPAQ